MEYDRSLPPPISTGLRGRCPRCGRGNLFKGFLSLKPQCEVCGLEYAFADSGDGPAFFVMSIVGIVVVALAMWVHMALWLPLIVALSLGLVRPSKGVLIALQYRHKAEQGRFKL